MACVTSVATTTSTSTSFNRATAVRARNARIVVTPTSRLVAFRLPSTPRSVGARATYSNSWNPMSGACGPSYSQRWRGSGQRSFEKWAEQANNNMWFPVDVEETAQEYTFVADVPGLGKNDIKVQVNKDRELSISGERHQPSSTGSSSSNASDDVTVEGSEGGKAAASKVQRKRQERRFGTFKRTWNLPEDADVSQIRASVDQGVLKLVISRTQPAEPEVTEIPIN